MSQPDANNAVRDGNHVPTALFQSTTTSLSFPGQIDQTTGRILVDSAGGSGTVTSVSVVSANGLAGTVATATTTPAITLSTTVNSPVLAGNGTAISAATTTGTGSTVVLNASPTFTGTVVAAAENIVEATGQAITLNGSYSTAGASQLSSPILSLIGTGYADNAGTLATEALTMQHTLQNGTVSAASISKTLVTVPTLGGLQQPQFRYTTNAATAGQTSYSGPIFASQGNYWNGSASVSYGSYFSGNIDSTGPTGHMSFGLFNNGAATEQLQLLSAGNLLLTTGGATFGLSGASSGTTVLTAVSVASGTLTLPAATDTLVGRATTDTLTNKTLTSPTLTTPSLGVATATSINGNILTTGSSTYTGTAAATYTFPGASATIAGLGTAQTFTGQDKFNNIIDVNNAITASGNAATVPVTFRLNTVTNNSAATLTITMTTASAVDGQMTIVRILDASAVAQTITWVNTENSTVTAPTTSNGSTTLFLTVGFIYNGGTSKWRCLAVA